MPWEPNREDAWKGLSPDRYRESPLSPAMFDRYADVLPGLFGPMAGSLLGPEHAEPARQAFRRPISRMLGGARELPLIGDFIAGMGREPFQDMYRAFELMNNRAPTEQEMDNLFGLIGPGFEEESGAGIQELTAGLRFRDRAKALRHAAANNFIPEGADLEEWLPHYYTAAREFQRNHGGSFSEALQHIAQSGLAERGVAIEDLPRVIALAAHRVRMRGTYA